MLVSTYNVNGVNGRRQQLLDWLAAAKPDVVCLQELKAEQKKFPRKALQETADGRRSFALSRRAAARSYRQCR